MNTSPPARTARHGKPARLRLGSALLGLAGLLAGLVVLVATAPPASAGPAPVMTGYVPLPADEFAAALETAGTGVPPNPTLRFTVGVTNAGDGAVLYYDHWEDGYEADIANPVLTTTLVYGDGDPTNGDASTVLSCGTRCAGDTLPAGAVLLFQNDITTPRDTSELFDGRDKVASTRGFSLVAGGYPVVPGSVISGVVSAFDTTKYGLDYIAPVGQDTYENLVTAGTDLTGTNDSMAAASLIVSAALDGTVVNIDRDADGIFEQTVTLNEGEVFLANGGVLEGARVTASKPVQVHLSTGDPAATYESRWFTLFPTPLLSADYISPMGSSVSNFLTILYAHNPGLAPITVTPTCAGCTGTLTIPAGETRSFATPPGEAVRLTSGGEPFIAIGATGAQSGAPPGTAPDVSTTWDSGFTLIPTNLLTSQVVLSWAPGNSAVPPITPGAGNFDDDPVWITTLADTTLYVDFDGDPATGSIPGVGTCAGELFDRTIGVTAATSTRIFDDFTGGTGDGDMTGSRIAACDGTRIAGAWAEDPESAPAGAPGFDAGYTIIPTTIMVVNKTAGLYVDANGDGAFGPGDTIEYTIAIADAGALALTNVTVEDGVPAGTTYVPGSSVYDGGGGPIAIPDDGSGTAYPLDGGGYLIPDIPAGNTVSVRYRVLVNALVPGQSSLTNTVAVTAAEASATDVLVTPLAVSDLSLTKTLITAAPVYTGDSATYRLTLTNSGPDPAAGVQVTDLLPTGVTYVSHGTTNGAYNPGTGLWSGIALASGASATLDLNVTIDALSTENFAAVTASGSVDPDSQPGAPLSQDDEDSLLLIVVPAPRVALSITKSDGGLPVGPGGTVIYTLTYGNGAAANQVATNVVLTETVPVGTTFNAGSSTAGWSCSPDTTAGSTCTLAVGAVAINAGGTATFAVTLPGTVPAGFEVVTNTATIADDATHGPDTNPADNTATDTTPVTAAPDLSVTKTDGGVSASPGGLVTYDIVYANVGSQGAAGVVLTETVPAGTTFVAGASTTGWVCVPDADAGSVCTLALGALVAGGSGTAEFTVRVDYPVPSGQTQLANTVTIADDGTGGTDPNPANNTSSDTTPITAGTLGNRIYLDVNGNDAFDAGEGFAGVDVDVVWPGPDNDINTVIDNVTRTATTDANGEWILTGLPAGALRVVVDTTTLPPGLTNTVDPDTGNDSLSTVTLTPGGINLDQDFGYRGTGSIGDLVWRDDDADGVRDLSEPGLVGVDLTATWSGPDNDLSTPADNETWTTTTDTLGAYLFTDLPAGLIRIAVTGGTPPGSVPTYDADGLVSPDGVVVVNLGPAQDFDLADFGYRPPRGALGDTVFSDTNGDGLQQPGEPGLGNVVVTLTQTAGGSITRSTTTSGTGTYAFVDLPPGTYTVTVTPPAGQTATTPTTFSRTIGQDQTDNTADFGFEPPAPPAAGTIGDTVFTDANASGGQDPGESGIAGATVTLRIDRDRDGSFETVGATQTTGADGRYMFANLPPGSYEVVVSVPPGLFPTTPTAVAVPITSGEVVLSADFGLRATVAPPGSIGDTVFNDADGDGIQGLGETGVAGVTLTLRRDIDGDGAAETIVGTTTTGLGGAYGFANLPPGSYTVTVTAPPGQAATTATTLPVALSSGEQVGTADFGLTTQLDPAPGAVTGRVWSDTNRDQVQDAAEPGVNGATVQLRQDSDGDGVYDDVVDIALSAGNGLFSFTDVPPGRYLVVITPPAGQGLTTVGSYIVDVTPGATVTGNDFGLASPGPVPFDLQVDKSVEGPVQQGELASYLLVVTNNGINATPDPLTLTDVLPAGLTYQGYAGPGWSCVADGQTVMCLFMGSLDVGDSVELHLLVLVGPTVTAGSALVNEVGVSAAGVELSTLNNSDSATVVVLAAAITPAVPVGPTTTIPPGETIDVVFEEPEDLPLTGTAVGRTALLALVLMGAGLGLLALRRRRPGSTTAG